ncbi:hypothetical protein [Brevundimonas aurantiaca]|uniref:hypothetical protein n=1 Tax=Brevundimonas aurantiaca TaxID=74316 RepID=UPI00174D3AD2|nr:hypothetical protein [Brevundimonas aurantiaca]
MSQGIHRKIRSDAIWAEVRKAWEAGETARSVARRYDVGVHALWKRREAEGWARPEPKAGPVEPAEGWGAYVQGGATPSRLAWRMRGRWRNVWSRR